MRWDVALGCAIDAANLGLCGFDAEEMMADVLLAKVKNLAVKMLLLVRQTLERSPEFLKGSFVVLDELLNVTFCFVSESGKVLINLESFLKTFVKLGKFASGVVWVGFPVLKLGLALALSSGLVTRSRTTRRSLFGRRNFERSKIESGRN